MMKLTSIALLASIATTKTMAAANLMRRDLRVETSGANTIVAGLRDDELGANEDFWGSWENQYAGYLGAQEDIEPSSDDTESASGTSELDFTVGDLPAAAKEVFQKAESVVTAALPFSIKHATSLVLPLGLVAAAMLMIAVAAVLIGVRRQQLSEPVFGPVELVSDLPDPMTTSAASEAEGDDSDKCSSNHGDEADTGATILAEEEQEEEKEEEQEEFVVTLA
ncbi:hypothetical protein F441_20001 [Phytophthora nicotianae CJ01A1]|uniref:RxLR effector protein n=5 Tax=Phytophthora nicotianae TaxID=4792 RepID=W2PIR8_PHYN3|nr:hypothetical protein PPTG_17985 [Phytophthora nicotianae INRA-310]ETI33193.1 hypothetical protein F443_20122 [Phytophthora nicotianae P1569]ETK73506.1 hypothetical protein L915_19585 [Phytophthora nicotianae]ETP02998.1 hypothetical protein F441_20001 [Phytophthora nicotianae CJ01A1]ETL80183.1 hypothetical protein L917_19314 [Phytophthora nicotianae]ETM33432.1 hypothetical protein L914_19350 [Phytophthora nicotianae]